MTILADIGGTYARFACDEGGEITRAQKYAAADFPSLGAALTAYLEEEGLEGGGALSIATAAYEDGDVWRFVNRNEWVIDPVALESGGWDLFTIVNDFAAATWGLLSLGPEDQEILKQGVPAEDCPRCLIGPGTGLGLGYLVPVGSGYHVQRTHGGHMPAAALTDEQWLMIKTVHRLKETEMIPVFENFVSGPGLYNIYQALCFMAGRSPLVEGPEGLLDHVHDYLVQDALRLFHEFFGLFAATVVITGHAYGGLYLTGGVLGLLEERGLFDFEQFEEFFTITGVDSVTEALRATPVIKVTQPWLALKGLQELKRRSNA